MQFANLRAREERTSPGAAEFALRRGGSGAGLEELQAQTRCEIRETSAPLLRQADRLLARQTSAHRAGPAFKRVQSMLNQPAARDRSEPAPAGPRLQPV
jgi:hypothetical protein